jgi:hypothetical protein
MPYPLDAVTLELESPVRYQTWVHTSRDGHLIGVIRFTAPPQHREAQWDDLEYMRRRTDEFAIIGFPEFLEALIIDLSDLPFLLDAEAPIFPWRLMNEDCPVRLLISREQRDHYTSVFEPAWLDWDLDTAIRDLREFLDAQVH